LRETYIKIKYNSEPFTAREMNCFHDGRTKATYRKLNNEIFNKKAEICMLRDKVDNLKIAIGTILQGIKNAKINTC